GRIDPQAVAALAAQAQLHGDDLPPLLKTMMLTVEHVQRHYYGMPFVKAHNLRLELRRQVEAALAGVDVIVTPTTPAVAHKLIIGPRYAEELLYQVGFAFEGA